MNSNILGLIFAVIFIISPPVKADSIAFSCIKVSNEAELIAKLASGIWVENDYYSKDVFKQLLLVSFKGLTLLNDGHYFEKISSVEKLEVSRVVHYLSGSQKEIIRLSEIEFWKRILFIEYQIKHKSLAYLYPIDISIVDNWWVTKSNKCRD